MRLSCFLLHHILIVLCFYCIVCRKYAAALPLLLFSVASCILFSAALYCFCSFFYCFCCFRLLYWFLFFSSVQQMSAVLHIFYIFYCFSVKSFLFFNITDCFPVVVPDVTKNTAHPIPAGCAVFPDFPGLIVRPFMKPVYDLFCPLFIVLWA